MTIVHANIVLAHPEQKSYNAHLADVARRALEGGGWTATVLDLGKIREIPFNRMADWGSDGRVLPNAPVHSPFIRHRQELPLE